MYLAFVAINVEAAIQCNNPNCFIFPLFWHDWLVADTASWREFPSEKKTD